MKPAPLFLLASAFVLLQACSSSEGKNETINAVTEKIPVRVISLQTTQTTNTIQTAGLFTTDDETMLAFKTGGIIEKIYVKEGDAIRKGQMLASLNLTEIEAQVAQATLAFEKATRDFKRVENLYKDSVATLEQFQNSKTGLSIAQKQLEAAQFNRSYSEIRALTNGYVLRKLANEGQVITSGTSVLQTNGASQNTWKLRTGVSDREWALIQVGNPAIVTSDALPNQTLNATVTRKSESTDGQSGTFSIELTIENKAKGLASGLFGKASIKTNKSQSVWKIPYDALLDGDSQRGYVFTTNDLQTAKKTIVEIGSVEKDFITIKAGLENAKHLIITGSAYLRDGSAIQVVE